MKKKTDIFLYMLPVVVVGLVIGAFWGADQKKKYDEEKLHNSKRYIKEQVIDTMNRYIYIDKYMTEHRELDPNADQYVTKAYQQLIKDNELKKIQDIYNINHDAESYDLDLYNMHITKMNLKKYPQSVNMQFCRTSKNVKVTAYGINKDVTSEFPGLMKKRWTYSTLTRQDKKSNWKIDVSEEQTPIITC